jgi:hypothetical protein
MATPTDATKVFSPITSSASTGTQQTTNFPIDLQMAAIRGGNGTNTATSSRLQGINSTPATVNTPYLVTSTTDAEATASFTRAFDNTSFQIPSYLGGSNTIYWSFQRAPGFFDEVCYTGSSADTSQTLNHSLGVAPSLMIIKSRSTSGLAWTVYAQPIFGTGIGGFSGFDLLQLNNNGNAGGNNKQINQTAPTSSVFSVGYSGITFSNTNNPGSTYVAYLFATCPGVSKVGSYTGNGTTQTIDCGFAGGARFVLIKRADSTGDWYVYDTARGMTTLTDPYLLLNSTAAETATLGSVTTVTTGFALNSTILAAINVSGGTYIFLAIA